MTKIKRLIGENHMQVCTIINVDQLAQFLKAKLLLLKVTLDKILKNVESFDYHENK